MTGGPAERTIRVMVHGPSRQRKGGPGKFKSERQRRFLWATRPAAARKWAYYRKTRKTDWIPRRGSKVWKRRRR